MMSMQQPTSREQRLARAITKGMEARGMDVRALSAATGLDAPTLDERLARPGSLAFPDFCAIADAIGVPAAELVAGIGGPDT